MLSVGKRRKEPTTVNYHYSYRKESFSFWRESFFLNPTCLNWIHLLNTILLVLLLFTFDRMGIFYSFYCMLLSADNLLPEVDVAVLLLRAGCLIFRNNHRRRANTFFGILPSPIALLEHYQRQPNLHPSWVEFVNQRLEDPRLEPREYEMKIQDFLHAELCFATRDQICFLYELIFDGREAPSLLIDAMDLNSILDFVSIWNRLTLTWSWRLSHKL